MPAHGEGHGDAFLRTRRQGYRRACLHKGRKSPQTEGTEGGEEYDGYKPPIPYTGVQKALDFLPIFLYIPHALIGEIIQYSLHRIPYQLIPINY